MSSDILDPPMEPPGYDPMWSGFWENYGGFEESVVITSHARERHRRRAEGWESLEDLKELALQAWNNGDRYEDVDDGSGGKAWRDGYVYVFTYGMNGPVLKTFWKEE